MAKQKLLNNPNTPAPALAANSPPHMQGPVKPTSQPITSTTPGLVPVAKAPIDIPKAPTSGWTNKGTTSEPNWVPAGANPGLSPMGRMGGTVQVPAELTSPGMSASERFYAQEARQHLQNITDFQNQQAVAQQQAAAKQFAPVEANIGQMTPEQQAAIANAKPGENIAGAVTVGGAGAMAGAATGAVAGLAGGPLAPASVPIGALAGLVIGILGKMKISKKQTVRDAYSQFTTAKAAMGTITKAARSTDPREHLDPTLAVEAWNHQYEQMLIAETILKKETKGSISAFLSGGGDELTKIEAWRQLEDQTHIYSNDLRSAIEGTVGAQAADYTSAADIETGILG